ncbi:MAG: hypothetical protein KDJ77_11610 [Rhodobiaceae bacterium]|nr:hypothetical protein [Rhodobiaceae bacterium]
MAELSLKEKLDITAKFLGIFASIAGGAIWLQAYVKDVNQRITDRQKETIRYHELYNSQNMLAARETFAQFRANAFDALGPQLSSIRSPRQADEEVPKILRAEMDRQIAATENKTHIPRLITFFEQLHVCIDVGLCDAESARMLFKGEAYELNFLLAGYIDAKRRHNPDFGAGLEDLGYETNGEAAARIRREMERRTAN